MRVIVEGPDGAGKTTLIELLEIMLDIERQPRRVGTDGVALVDLGQTVQDDLALEVTEPETLRLYDRHPLISGPIYDPFIKGEFTGHQENPFHDGLMASMATFYGQHNLVIVCLPPLGVVQRYLEENPADQLDCFRRDGYIGLHYWAYVNYALMVNNLTPWMFRYDYTEWNGEDLRMTLNTLLRTFEAAA